MKRRQHKSGPFTVRIYSSGRSEVLVGDLRIYVGNDVESEYDMSNWTLERVLDKVLDHYGFPDHATTIANILVLMYEDDLKGGIIVAFFEDLEGEFLALRETFTYNNKKE